MNNPKTEWSGIDTLKVGIGIHWDPITRQHQMRLLNHLQEQARAGREPTLETLQYRWNITPYGRKKYKWGMTTGYMSFFFSDEDAPHADNTPNAWAEFGPLWTTRHTPEMTKAFIDIHLNNMGAHATWIKPSELHITADISTDQPMKYEDFYAEHHQKLWTTRARITRLIETPDERPEDEGECIFRNGNLEYFRVGAGMLLLRIYNKTKELRTHTEKMWEQTLWKNPQAQNVTRIEFQLRREKLYQFGTNTMEALADVPGIWSYLTQAWFYMHDEVRKTHTLPPSKFWETVQRSHEKAEPATPHKIWKPNAYARINSGIGNLLSAAAQLHHENPDKSEARELVDMLKIWKQISKQAKPTLWEAVNDRRERLRRRTKEHLIAPAQPKDHGTGDVISHPPKPYPMGCQKHQVYTYSRNS